MSNGWDNPDFAGGEFYTFTDVGDSVTGVMVGAPRTGTDFNGNPCPEITLRNPAGIDTKVTLAQAQLKAKALKAKPVEGDTVTLTFTGEEKAAKGMKKLFDVTVIKGDGSVPQAAATPSDGNEEPF